MCLGKDNFDVCTFVTLSMAQTEHLHSKFAEIQSAESETLTWVAKFLTDTPNRRSTRHCVLPSHSIIALGNK